MGLAILAASHEQRGEERYGEQYEDTLFQRRVRPFNTMMRHGKTPTCLRYAQEKPQCGEHCG